MDILSVGILIILLSDKTSTQLYNTQFDTIERYEILIKSRYDLCLENRQVPRDRDRIDRDIHSPCCGYCSTKSSCYKYRTCCVDMFDSLAEAQSFMANTGFECVRLQYLSGNFTKYTVVGKVWMVTKCPTNINQSLVSLCENNPITGNVDDIIPVTDLVSNTHYKNLHCARCNGKDDTNIMATWSLKIHNDVFIKFPEKDLLAKIRSREGNIFLVPPDYVMVEACFLPPYTISRCNVSGLWSSYDQYIVQSCNLFVDPFNSTYQNAFCYLCNIPTYNISEPINTCIDPFLMDVAYDEPKAQFQALVDVVTVTQQADDESRIDKSNLACDRTKFKDEIQMICRPVMCHPSRELTKGVCAHFTPDTQSCLNIAIKFTAFGLSNMTVDELNGTHIRGTIVTLLDDHIPGIEEEIMSLEMYFISHETKVIQFGSIIASMVVNQCPKVYACLDIEQLVNIHNRSFSETLLENNMTMYIWVELSGLVAEQQETDKSVSGKAFSKFYYSVRNNIDNTCIGKEGVNFKKTHVCPFVEISKADMAILVDDMKNTNESGLVFLESWEYEDLEYQWRICFNDFIYIQVRARRRSIVPMDQKGEGRNSVSIAVSLNCICFVFFMVIHC